MLKIPWIAKRPNEEVLKDAEEKRQAITKFRNRPSTFIGHAVRVGGLNI